MNKSTSNSHTLRGTMHFSFRPRKHTRLTVAGQNTAEKTTYHDDDALLFGRKKEEGLESPDLARKTEI